MNRTLIVGIDGHSKTNTACFIDSEGTVIERNINFKNNFPQAKEFEQKILQTIKQGGFTSAKIGIEAVSVYHFHLTDFLACSEALSGYATEVYQVNPKLTAGFKKAYADVDKTDDIDAFIAAERIRFGRLPRPYKGYQNWLPLQRLTRFRFHLTDSIAREKNYFLLNLFLRYSSFKDVKPFSNTFGRTSIELILEDFFLDDLAAKPLEELAEYIAQQGRSHFKDSKETARAVQKMARESYRIRPSLATSVSLVLAMCIQNIRAFSKSLNTVNKAIACELKGFPNTLESVIGLGPVYSAGIFAEIGDVNNFPSEAQLAKFAGLTWRKTESASFKGEVTRMTKTGNKYLRYYLLEAANSLRVHNEEFKAYYQKKYNEVPKHRHKRAVAFTARKLVRLVYSLLKDNHLYRPTVERSLC